MVSARFGTAGFRGTMFCWTIDIVWTMFVGARQKGETRIEESFFASPLQLHNLAPTKRGATTKRAHTKPFQKIPIRAKYLRTNHVQTNHVQTESTLTISRRRIYHHDEIRSP